MNDFNVVGMLLIVATALCGKKEFAAARANILADAFFAGTIIRGSVDEVYTRIEYLVE